jgi:hypothetical protein
MVANKQHNIEEGCNPARQFLADRDCFLTRNAKAIFNSTLHESKTIPLAI